MATRSERWTSADQTLDEELRAFFKAPDAEPLEFDADPEPDPPINGSTPHATHALEAPEAPEPSHYHLEPPSPADVDRLWDWIRLDGPATLTDFGVSTSLDLHLALQNLARGELNGSSWARMLYLDEEHVGLVSVAPIVGQIGLLHLFVSPLRRGIGLQAAKFAYQAVQDQFPDLQPLIITDSERIVRFCRRIGFKTVRYVVQR